LACGGRSREDAKPITDKQHRRQTTRLFLQRFLIIAVFAEFLLPFRKANSTHDFLHINFLCSDLPSGPERLYSRGLTESMNEMIPKAFLERESISSPVLLAIAGLLATTIFVVDTLSPLGMAVAVLYVIVVLLSTNVLQWRGVLFVSLGCVALTLSSYLLAHGVSYTGAHFVRLLVSLSAIAITAFLALRNQAAFTVLSEQARLLDLTHDMIFVRTCMMSLPIGIAAPRHFTVGTATRRSVKWLISFCRRAFRRVWKKLPRSCSAWGAGRANSLTSNATVSDW